MSGRAAAELAAGLRRALGSRATFPLLSDLAELQSRAEQADRLREELMRVGLLAVSDRIDGCIPRAVAHRIRGIAHSACWPDEASASSAGQAGEGDG